MYCLPKTTHTQHTRAMEERDKVKKIFESLGIDLDDHQIGLFLSFYEYLVEKNRYMNLTAITEFDDVLIKHFADSASICRLFEGRIPELTEKTPVMDMGTGGGFPGIPLKILYPQVPFVLSDSLNKRIVFLQDVIEKLGLKKIDTVHGRAEDLGQMPAYREKFSLCVSRAVANLSSLAEYCLPFVKKGGFFIAYKSGNVKEEADKAQHAISVLGGKMLQCEKFTLPSSDIERTFIIIEKIKETPSGYPRKAGLPGKAPL